MVGYLVFQPVAEIIIIAHRNLTHSPCLSEDHERRVDGDACEPSSETGPALEVPHVNERSQ